MTNDKPTTADQHNAVNHAMGVIRIDAPYTDTDSRDEVIRVMREALKFYADKTNEPLSISHWGLK